MTKTDMTTENSTVARRRRANGWPVLPLRIFLAALFLFAGYAKLAYPHFFDPNSVAGFKASIDAAKTGTPIGGILGPLSDHPSVFGHITAFAEIAIGLGLLVGLLTRFAAAGGIVLMASIVLSIDWGGVKQYTGSSGWFTSVDLAVGAALSVYLIGGADPFSLDALIWRSRIKRRERDDLEPGFRDNELAESRARLQGDYAPAAGSAGAAETTQRLPEPEPNSLWNAGRRENVDPDATRTTERPMADRPVAERPVSDRPVDRPASDQPVVERPGEDQRTARFAAGEDQTAQFEPVERGDRPAR